MAAEDVWMHLRVSCALESYRKVSRSCTHHCILYINDLSLVWLLFNMCSKSFCHDEEAQNKIIIGIIKGTTAKKKAWEAKES